MEKVFRQTQPVPSADAWVAIGPPVPAYRWRALAAAALADRDVVLRLVQGDQTSPSNYQWVRASDESEVPANAPGGGLLSSCGFEWAQLQVKNTSGQLATVTGYVNGLGEGQ